LLGLLALRLLSSFAGMLVSPFFFIFLKAPPNAAGVLEDIVGEREIELGGQTSTTAATGGMKLG
jgi:hypothetical protein